VLPRVCAVDAGSLKQPQKHVLAQPSPFYQRCERLGCLLIAEDWHYHAKIKTVATQRALDIKGVKEAKTMYCPNC